MYTCTIVPDVGEGVSVDVVNADISVGVTSSATVEQAVTPLDVAARDDWAAKKIQTNIEALYDN